MGNIRKKTCTVNGKTYIYYEARYTEGFDPGTGKQIQRSISGKTQKEVAQKLKAALASLDSGTYIAPSKMTVGQWMDLWSDNYLGGVKDSTYAAYDATIRTHIKPGLGAIRIDSLDTHMVQSDLGHATAAFTLDVYGHVTYQMQESSASRMQAYINDILNM